MGILTVGQGLLRGVAGDTHKNELTRIVKEFIEDPAEIGSRDVLENIDADDAVESLGRKLAEGFEARVIAADRV